MQKQAGVRPAEEIGQQVFGLTGAVLQVDCLQDGKDVLEQEGGVVAAAAEATGVLVGVCGSDGVGVVVGVFRVGEEGKDLKLAADPEAGARKEVWRRGKLDGGRR